MEETFSRWPHTTHSVLDRVSEESASVRQSVQSGFGLQDSLQFGEHSEVYVDAAPESTGNDVERIVGTEQHFCELNRQLADLQCQIKKSTQALEDFELPLSPSKRPGGAQSPEPLPEPELIPAATYPAAEQWNSQPNGHSSAHFWTPENAAPPPQAQEQQQAPPRVQHQQGHGVQAESSSVYGARRDPYGVQKAPSTGYGVQKEPSSAYFDMNQWQQAPNAQRYPQVYPTGGRQEPEIRHSPEPRFAQQQRQGHQWSDNVRNSLELGANIRQSLLADGGMNKSHNVFNVYKQQPAQTVSYQDWLPYSKSPAPPRDWDPTFREQTQTKIDYPCNCGTCTLPAGRFDDVCARCRKMYCECSGPCQRPPQADLYSPPRQEYPRTEVPRRFTPEPTVAQLNALADAHAPKAKAKVDKRCCLIKATSTMCGMLALDICQP